MKENRDRSVTITADMVRRAGENLILRRETHLHQLTDKLSEDRVRRVIEPILAGVDKPDDVSDDDLDYVRDLGLIKARGETRIANRIYQEVIPRALTYGTQATITHKTEWYVRESDGLLDMGKLLAAFQDFFRKHSQEWKAGFRYKEAGAQLLMQAFLQRILNSGGQLHREYGLGMMHRPSGGLAGSGKNTGNCHRTENPLRSFGNNRLGRLGTDLETHGQMRHGGRPFGDFRSK